MELSQQSWNAPETPARSFFSPRMLLIGAILLASFVACIVFLSTQPPEDFPTDTLVRVEEGRTLTEIADELELQNVVRSSFLFRNLIILMRREKTLISGNYLFSEPLPLHEVVERISSGKRGISLIKVTIPEGFTVSQIADTLEKSLSGFDRDAFLLNAAGKEGYLFPDTYFFMPGADVADIIAKMEENFENKMREVEAEIKDFGRSASEILIMASILEEEARTTETRRTIAGILWKRLDIGMPLQVDSTLTYVTGRNTYNLTQTDLKSDSPYNSYQFAGLPPGPITNPGLDSLRAAATPIKSKYLYFLSDREGNMHYATTFEGHKKNRILYLD